MPPLKNNRRELYCLNLIKGMTQQDAAIRAGYMVTMARRTASRMMTKVDIINRIVELNTTVTDNAIVTFSQVVRCLDAGIK